MSESLERAAQAIYELREKRNFPPDGHIAWDEAPTSVRDYNRDLARAALAENSVAVMHETRFTPPPWYAGKLREDSDFGTHSVSVGPFEADEHYEDTICEVWGDNHDAEANAALVAAAPDLHTAAAALLADVRRRYPGEELRCPLMRALDAAVLKVTGDVQ